MRAPSVDDLPDRGEHDDRVRVEGVDGVAPHLRPVVALARVGARHADRAFGAPADAAPQPRDVPDLHVLAARRCTFQAAPEGHTDGVADDEDA